MSFGHAFIAHSGITSENFEGNGFIAQLRFPTAGVAVGLLHKVSLQIVELNDVFERKDDIPIRISGHRLAIGGSGTPFQFAQTTAVGGHNLTRSSDIIGSYSITNPGPSDAILFQAFCKGRAGSVEWRASSPDARIHWSNGNDLLIRVETDLTKPNQAASYRCQIVWSEVGT